MDSPDKSANMVIEIKLHRNTKSGMWDAEAYAHWDGVGSEHCTCIDGNEEAIYSTRAEAATAMNAQVREWIAKNA